MKKNLTPIVKESLSENLDESIRFKDAYFDTHHINKFDRIYAGKKGILGDKGIIIPWSVVKRLLEKYEDS